MPLIKILYLGLIIIPYYSCAQVGEYGSFFNNLPVDSTSIDTNALNYNKYWKVIINVEQKSVLNESKKFNKLFKSIGENYERPDLKPFLDRKLIFKNKEIIEVKSKEANDVIGFTKCNSGNATIIYASKPSQSICMEAFVFFREHEYAHFKLGHSGCGLSSDVFDNHRKEMDADLEARNTILKFKDGQRIMDFIIATFSVLNLRQDQYHPSSKDRIQNLILN